MTTKTIQMTIDSALLAEVDDVARELETTRSALIRSALMDYLRTLRIRRLELQHRAAFEHQPHTDDEIVPWEAVQEWGDL